MDQEPRAATDLPARDADRPPLPRAGRPAALIALAAGAAMVVLSLTGLTGVDRRLESIAGDADQAGAARPGSPAYPADVKPCGRDERPSGAQRGRPLLTLDPHTHVLRIARR